MMKRGSWFGVALIVVGTVMILDRLGVFRFGWHSIFWMMLAIIGLFKGTDGFSKKRAGQVFWGTFLFLLGIYNLLREIDIIELRSYWWLPAMLLMLGFSFLMMFACKPKEWHLLVPTLTFLGIGGAMVLTEFGFFYHYDLAEAIRMYWPVALILFGLSLVVHRLFPRSKE